MSSDYSDALWEAEKRQRRFEAVVSQCVGDGLLQPETPSVTFLNSDKEREKPNSEIWNKFQAMPFEKHNTWIYGPQGCGKTYLARCIIAEYLYAGLSASEISAMEFIGTVDSWGWLDLVKCYTKTEVFLLDAFDSAFWTPRAITGLHYVFAERGKAGRRTIVTANNGTRKASAEFENLVGAANMVKLFHCMQGPYGIHPAKLEG